MKKYIKVISSINRICEIEEFLNSLYIQYNFSRKLYCKIFISVTEAVNNAIVHGNKGDISKFIHIRFFNIKGKYIFIIEDEGEGFDYNNLPDPTLTDNIRNESGRGIFFMRKYADAVLFKNNGSCVKLTFFVPSD